MILIPRRFSWLSFLSLDDAGQHHLVLGADRFGVLIGGSGKGLQISSNLSHFSDLVHQTVLRAINRSGVIIVFLDQFVHFLDDRLEGSSSSFFFYQAAGKAGSGCRFAVHHVNFGCGYTNGKRHYAGWQ